MSHRTAEPYHAASTYHRNRTLPQRVAR